MKAKATQLAGLFNDDSNNAFNELCLWLEREARTNLLTLDE